MQERPSIFAADVLAWTLYKSKHDAEAAHAIQQALRLGTKNALMHYHAGMIYNRLGDSEKAGAHLRMAMSINPHFSVRYEPTARQLLVELQPRIAVNPDVSQKTTFSGTAARR